MRDGGQPHLCERRQLDAQWSRRETHAVGDINQTLERRTLERYRMIAPHRLQIRFDAVITRDHREAR